jgi:hypothetical protein
MTPAHLSMQALFIREALRFLLINSAKKMTISKKIPAKEKLSKKKRKRRRKKTQTPVEPVAK